MRWTEDGRIQVTRNFALGAAVLIGGLALVMMLLIGMLIAGNDDEDPKAEINPTPIVMAAEEETETPTLTAQTAIEGEATETLTRPQTGTETPARPQTGTKIEYSTCLVRTQRTLALDAEDARFTPWPDYGDNRSVWDVIRYRHINYIGDHCRSIAPPPASTYSSTCIPREIQSFYRRHIPEGADNDTMKAIAAEYALTVCQPSAER